MSLVFSRLFKKKSTVLDSKLVPSNESDVPLVRSRGPSVSLLDALEENLVRPVLSAGDEPGEYVTVGVMCSWSGRDADSMCCPVRTRMRTDHLSLACHK